jgi:DNA (cytosine-5)-methyltransferase 1
VKYISLFSGLGSDALAFQDLGWTPLCFSEIEPFQSAVLAKHFPDVPNLGDITKVDWSQYKGKVDLVIGGPPCQSFSTAGRRGGMSDPRGALLMDFLRIVEVVSPKLVVVENVEGLLSDNNGGTIQIVLDFLTQIGYAVDADILDAKGFGLPQRRRRVFLICVKCEDLLKMKTPISGRIIAELLCQILHVIWEELAVVSFPEKSLLDSMSQAELFANSPIGKMRRLNGLLGGSAVIKLLDYLGETIPLSTSGPGKLGTPSPELFLWSDPELAVEVIESYRLPKTVGDSGNGSTALSQKKFLVDLWEWMSGSTISTSTSLITDEKICMFAGISLNIVECMPAWIKLLRTEDWSRSSWSLASYALTVLGDIIGYARQKGYESSENKTLRSNWRNHQLRAERCLLELGPRIGESASRQGLLFEPQGYSGDTQDRAADRAEAAPRPSGGARKSSIRVYPDERITDGYYAYDRLNNTVSTVIPAVSKSVGLTTGRSILLEAKAGELKLRRLIPAEVERLQGFPTDWTAIPWRGKPASDKIRYEALANAFPSPMIRWLGERIAQVEKQ